MKQLLEVIKKLIEILCATQYYAAALQKNICGEGYSGLQIEYK